VVKFVAARPLSKFFSIKNERGKVFKNYTIAAMRNKALNPKSETGFLDYFLIMQNGFQK
jgi:hypothetical protein